MTSNSIFINILKYLLIFSATIIASCSNDYLERKNPFENNFVSTNYGNINWRNPHPIFKKINNVLADIKSTISSSVSSLSRQSNEQGATTIALAAVAVVLIIVRLILDQGSLNIEFSTNKGTSKAKYIYEPVVLTGNDIPELIGKDIKRIVAYEYSNFAWTQIPIQIDERHIQSFEVIKKNSDCRIAGKNPTELVYADPNTYSGADEDPMFDSDDELVFMARHLGEKAEFWNLFGLKFFHLITNFEFLEYMAELPIGSSSDGTLGYIYLFLEPNNEFNEKLVNYDFKLTKTTSSNNYFDVYKFTCANPLNDFQCNDGVSTMNPEDTWFRSPYYERHFSQNWHSDIAHILAGDSDRKDIWGMEEIQFVPYVCQRSVKTFMQGPTAYIANINGPVRAIRSFVGANSGVITQRDVKMYEQREDTVTYVRVHSIPGMMNYINFEANVPMKYYNCRNNGGFNVDGQMSTNENNFDNRLCTWEMVTGNSGTFLRIFDFNFTDLDPEDDFQSWYYDNSSPDTTNSAPAAALGAPWFPNANFALCTGLLDQQQSAWGTMGIRSQDKYSPLSLMIPNSDPTLFQNSQSCGAAILGTANELITLEVTAKQYYLKPNVSISLAEELNQLKPLKRI